MSIQSLPPQYSSATVASPPYFSQQSNSSLPVQAVISSSPPLDAFSKTPPKASADALEIHDTKLWSSAWAAIPFIGYFATLGNLFTSPEKKATERPDVRLNNRDMYSAVEQEKALKNAKLKSQLASLIIPSVAFTLLALIKEKTVKTTVASLAFLIGGCVPLGYLLKEDPADANFNKQL